ncbi:hypothetical protein CXG50_12360 [Pseudomonas plecoglossicida]|uniref:hypothetical protein n=1 Tax=Pseudomonas TaxID=286 RepID=UPI000C7D2493|nr:MULTISPECIES: hypothetical protein [Pseudomonas]MCE0757100.1 hypothetical protein [Pseudomonas asiatica]MCE1032736.1 hypothetical protein [Pseudomonas asiatica]MCE1067435.1 hypothetical protein [Pseudomonas asiatica]MCE1102084.1 hypothetical protein [Pseudomonas asiatica]MCE1107639.1 hypothetical protein [Pseudomonas asiatica]
MEQQAVAETKFPVGRAKSFLLDHDWVEITRGEPVDLAEFDLGVCFQCGLATITRDGEILPATSELEVETSQNGSDWVPAFKGSWTQQSLDTSEHGIQVESNGLVHVRARKSVQENRDVRDDAAIRVRRKAGPSAEICQPS